MAERIILIGHTVYPRNLTEIHDSMRDVGI